MVALPRSRVRGSLQAEWQTGEETLHNFTNVDYLPMNSSRGHKKEDKTESGRIGSEDY